ELLEPIGDPAERIEEVADQGDYDTIVIGSRGLGALGRALQGSVSSHVATHAKSTVIVAR
ncbi:MAG TPA: universal stress protein, partial [Candidatus Binatus sp.]|nr:universal stress protein [Candidatus Binatus sp.]